MARMVNAVQLGLAAGLALVVPACEAFAQVGQAPLAVLNDSPVLPADAGAVAAGVTESTGAATLAIPIEAPVGPGGFSPTHALRYSSQSGDGIFGIGWSVGLSEIRVTTRFGNPGRVSALDATYPFELDGQLLVPTATAGHYHTRVESFADAFLSNDTWTVTYPNGMKAIYGSSGATRIRFTTGGQIFRYLLSELRDAAGNSITYEYAFPDGASSPYPKFIRWSNREIEFVLEARPDPLLQYPEGIQTTISRRVDKIKVRVGSTLFRQIDLDYANPVGVTYRVERSRIHTVTVTGFDTSGASPVGPNATRVHRFTYTDHGVASAPGGQRADAAAGTWVPPVPFASGGNGADTGVRTGDVNGDGLPDLVVARLDEDGNGATRAVYLNTGTGWGPSNNTFTTSLGQKTIPMRRIKFGNDGCYTGITPLNNMPFHFADELPVHVAEDSDPPQIRARVSTQLVDVNGDGRADLVGSYRVRGENCNRVQVEDEVIRVAYLNNGNGWDANNTTYADNNLPPFTSYEFGTRIFSDPSGNEPQRAEDGCLQPLHPTQPVAQYSCPYGAWVRLLDLGARYVELNGDGILDLIAGQTAYRYLDGHLSTSNMGVYNLDSDVKIVKDEGPWKAGDNAVRFVDLNADGLTDLIKTPAPPNDPDEEHHVWINTGRGWCSNCGAQYELSALNLSFVNNSFFEDQLSFVDLNADGYPDLIRTNTSQAGGTGAWLQNPSADPVWTPANDYAPPSVTQALPSMATNGNRWGARLIDLDGNGTLDFVRAYADHPDDTPTTLAQLSLANFSDKLESYDNGAGGLVEFTYDGATNQTKETLEQALANGLQAPNPEGVRRGSSVAVVAERKVTNADGPANANTWKYFYARSRFDPVLRESYGFAGVQVHRPDLSRTRSAYHQRAGVAGRLHQMELIERVGGNDVKLAQANQVWTTVAGGPAVGGSSAGTLIPRLTSQSDATFYGAGEIGSSRTLTYNDAYGYNFVSSDETVRGTRSRVVTRTPRNHSFVKGLVATERVEDAAQKVLRDATFLYNPTHGRLETSTRSSCQMDQPGCGETVVEQYTYDTYGNLRRVTDAGNRTTDFCYDGDTQYQSGNACPVFAASSDHSVVTGVRDPIGGQTQTTPNPATGAPGLVVSFNGDRTRYQRDGFGRPVARFFQPSRVGETHPEQKLDEWTYVDDPDAPGNTALRPYVEHKTFVDDTVSIREAIYGDGLGGVARRVAAGKDANQWIGEATGRDFAGRVIWETFPTPCGSDLHCLMVPTTQPPAPLPPSVTTTYDRMGRPTDILDRGGLTHIDYNKATLAGPLGSLALESVVVTDPKGNATARYSDFGQLTAVRECAVGACTTGPLTWYAHEATGELREIYDARGLSTPSLSNTYDMLSRLRVSNDAASGQQFLVYNPTGTLAGTIDAQSQVVYNEYDDLDRLVRVYRQEDQPNPPNITVPSAVLTYDPVTRELASVVEDGIYDYEQRYTYDAFGRVAQDILEIEGKTLVSKFEYDLAGRMTRYYSPASQMGIGYEYQNDYLSSVKELRDNYNGTTSYLFRWLDEVDYDTRGRPKDAFPVGRTSPYALHFGYDNAKQQLTDFSWDNGAIFDLHYGYDAADNVSLVEDQHTGAGVNGTIDFDHDARNRLKWWQRPGQAVKYMNYDALGNPIGKDVALPTDQNQTFGHATNPYAITGRPGLTYGYDPDGNQTTRSEGGTTQYRTFDSEGRLRCVGTSPGGCELQRFVYRFDGKRLTERVGGRTRILGPEGFTLQIEADASLTARFYSCAFGAVLSETTQTLTVLRAENQAWVWGGWDVIDRITPWLAVALATALLVALARLGMIERLRERPVTATVALVTAVSLIPIPAAFATPALPGGGTTTRVLFLGDQIGSSLVAVTVTNPPTVVDRRVFDPFGGEIAHESSGQPVPRTYAGQRYVAGANLYDFQARWYDGEAGRFLQVDPIGGLGDPGSLNVYSYVRNNPTTLVDPTGMETIVVEMPTGRQVDVRIIPGHDVPPVVIPVELNVPIRIANIGVPPPLIELSTRRDINSLFPAAAVIFMGIVPGFNLFLTAGILTDPDTSPTEALLATLGLAATPLELGELGALGSLTRVGLEADATTGGLSSSANFAQRTFREEFSKAGRRELSAIAGRPIRTVDDLAAAIRGGLDPRKIPVNIIERGGNTLILNTRTVQALERAGVCRGSFNVINRTGDELFESLLSGQLQRNSLTNRGISSVTPE